jgi:hypothetical protein
MGQSDRKTASRLWKLADMIAAVSALQQRGVDGEIKGQALAKSLMAVDPVSGVGAYVTFYG